MASDISNPSISLMMNWFLASKLVYHNSLFAFWYKKKGKIRYRGTIAWFLRLLLLMGRDIGDKIPMSMKHLSKQIIQITLITKVELLTNNWSLFLQIGERTKPSNRLLKIRMVDKAHQSQKTAHLARRRKKS